MDRRFPSGVITLIALMLSLCAGQALARAGDDAAGVQPLEALETALEELAAQVSDSVVAITLERHLALPGRHSAGSGSRIFEGG